MPPNSAATRVTKPRGWRPYAGKCPRSGHAPGGEARGSAASKRVRPLGLRFDQGFEAPNLSLTSTPENGSVEQHHRLHHWSGLEFDRVFQPGAGLSGPQGDARRPYRSARADTELANACGGSHSVTRVLN